MNKWAENISRMESPQMYEQLYGGVDASAPAPTPAPTQTVDPNQDAFKVPADGSQPGAYVDDEGMYQILTDQNGMKRYVTPGMQKHIENGTFGYMMNQGRYDNPDDAIFYEGGTQAQPGGTTVTPPDDLPTPVQKLLNNLDHYQRPAYGLTPDEYGQQGAYLGNRVLDAYIREQGLQRRADMTDEELVMNHLSPTPRVVETPTVVTPPPAPRTTPEDIIPAATPPAMGSIPTDIGAPLQPRSIESGMTPQLRTAESFGGYTPSGGTAPTESDGGFLDQVGGFLKQNLGTIVGTGLGLLQDKANMRAIEEMKGPIAAPMRDKAIYTPMQTDFMVGNQLNAIQQESARTAAAIQEAGGSPQLQAAMQRARQRTAAGQTANVLANEQQQELSLRNQNLQNINSLLNQNLDIDFQNRTTDVMNRQRTLDFENERMAARNRIRQDMANRLGAAGQEIASRAADRRRWELVSKMDQYGVIGRNDINPFG